MFVKGPFKSKENAEISSKVMEFKTFATGVSSLKVEIVEMEVCQLDNCQLGSRLALIGKRAWFQVWDDILVTVDTLPIKNKTSKAWCVPVSVVDWGRIDLFSHVAFEKDYTRSLYTQDVPAALELVRHVILSWICGCGGDLALRNFVYDKVGHRVHQVDLENWCNGKWELFNTRICSSRSECGVHFSRFIRENIVSVRKLVNALHTKKSDIQAKWSSTEAKFICDRIDTLHADLEGVLVIKESKGVKRRSPTPTIDKFVKKSKV